MSVLTFAYQCGTICDLFYISLNLIRSSLVHMAGTSIFDYFRLNGGSRVANNGCKFLGIHFIFDIEEL